MHRILWYHFDYLGLSRSHIISYIANNFLILRVAILLKKIKGTVLSRKINAIALLPAGLTTRVFHNKTASLSFYNLHADIRAYAREDEREQRPKGMRQRDWSAALFAVQ